MRHFLELTCRARSSVLGMVADEVSVFILPTSFEVLRGASPPGIEQPDDLALRLRNARGEVERYREFDMW